MSLMRLDKFFTSQEILSRKNVSIEVKKGNIKVNGFSNVKADMKIDTDIDKISYNDKLIEYKEHIYIMLNKPKGVVSATNDNLHKTVLDIIPKSLNRKGLFPAGRLDKDTTGFVLLTTNGDLAHKILAPKNHISKEYVAVLDKKINDEIVLDFSSGVLLSDGEVCKSAGLSIVENLSEVGCENYSNIVKNDENKQVVLVTLCEGKYHQIKRMFLKYDITVEELKRISMGSIQLDRNLSDGDCRELCRKEIDYLVSL